MVSFDLMSVCNDSAGTSARSSQSAERSRSSSYSHDAPQYDEVRKRPDQARGAAPFVGCASLPQERSHQVHGEQGANGSGGHRGSRQPQALGQAAALDELGPHGRLAAGLRAESVTAGASCGSGTGRDPARARAHWHEQRHLGLCTEERAHTCPSGLARRHFTYVPGSAARQPGGSGYYGGGQDRLARVTQQEEARGIDRRNFCFSLVGGGQEMATKSKCRMEAEMKAQSRSRGGALLT